MTNTQTSNEAAIATVRLGHTGPTVGRIGLGAMGMSGSYGPTDDVESTATIHAALDSGANLVDTGDFYGSGHNEALIGKALADRPREDYLLSVKFGALRGPDGSWNGFDARPEATKNFVTYSLQRLGVDHIDIYRPARLDPTVPIEETVGAIAELVDAGYVKHIGLSEVGAETIRRAAATAPIADLQIEYSIVSRSIENRILATTRELGIGVTAYGVLSRGLLSDAVHSGKTFGAHDFRAHSPRFQGDNLDRNLKLVETLAALAERHGASVAQLAIAWVLAQGDDIVPVLGARTRARWEESKAALAVELSTTELAEIEKAVPADDVAGERYAAAQFASLDSEK